MPVGHATSLDEIMSTPRQVSELIVKATDRDVTKASEDQPKG